MKFACAMRCCALLLWSVSSVAQQHPTCVGPQLGTWALLSMQTSLLHSLMRWNLTHSSSVAGRVPGSRVRQQAAKTRHTAGVNPYS